MKLFNYTFLVILLLVVAACGKKKEQIVNLNGIEAETNLVRFDQKFYTAAAEDLDQLKSEFPYLFPAPNPDSVWIAKMKDKDELFLYKSVQEEFDDFSQEKEALTTLFKHIKYYYPNFKEPKVITMLTNVDYNNKVLFADSLLFISADVYLGQDHEVYQDYPNYIRQNFRKEHLIVDVAEQLAQPVLRTGATNSFISRIIQEGKKLYVMQAFLPETKRTEIIGYDQDQYSWAEISESDIWKYFIQNEMLYSNDPNLSERFILDAPFSKFYLEVDKDSPGRIGSWFGWQIVDAFMQHNDISLQEMVLLDNEEIFRKSKYKPRKKY